MQDAWEQTFMLMADLGQAGAYEVVASGMQKTPDGEPEQYRRWEVLADCLNAVADASRTNH